MKVTSKGASRSAIFVNDYTHLRSLTFVFRVETSNFVQISQDCTRLKTEGLPFSPPHLNPLSLGPVVVPRARNSSFAQTAILENGIVATAHAAIGSVLHDH